MTKTFQENAGGTVQEQPESLLWGMVAIINDLRASVNEMRTDHLGSGTSYQVWATEITTDHATTKTALDAIETLIEELHDDHATQKTMNDAVEALIEEQHDDHEDFRDFLNYHFLRNGVTHIEDVSLFTFNSGTKDRIDIPEFDYRIGGVDYHYAGASALDWDEGGETINTAGAATKFWGAWYGCIDAAGTVTFLPTDVSGDSVWATEFAALMSINGDADLTAIPAGSIVFAHITVEAGANDDFIADTTEFDHADVETANFVMYPTLNDQIVACSGTSGDGRVITAHSGVAINATPEQFDVAGTAVAYLGGTRASLAASAAQTFLVADTVNTGTASSELVGAFGLFRDASGNDFTQSADGSVVASDQVYADAAAALTALDTLFIPAIYARVGTIVVTTKVSQAWVANTSDMTDASDCLTTVFAAQGAATAYEESANADSPVPPTLPAALGSSKPASGPGTLGSSKPASGPGTLGSSVPAAHGTAEIENIAFAHLGTP